MDFMTIIGLIGGAATVYYVMAAGDILDMLINKEAAILVFGGTIASTLIAYPWSILKTTLAPVRLMFFSPKNTTSYREELIDLITSLSEKARRYNIESLQSDIPTIENEYLANGLQLVVDGMEPEVIRESLEKDTTYTRQRNQKVCNVFRTMATLAPIFGLLGTLIGIVQVLRNLADPTSMGQGMAVAITTTFYGIFAANFVFLPMSIKISDHNENDIINMELITEGVLAIQKGDLPLIVKKKLDAFVISRIRAKGEAKKD